MNIFIAPQSPRANSNKALIDLLSKITRKKNSAHLSVIIDDLYASTNQLHEKKISKHAEINLTDFLYNRRDSTQIYFRRIVQLMSESDTSWFIIDFDKNDQEIFLGFIRKLSSFSFISGEARNKNLLLTVPGINLSAIASAIDELLIKSSATTYIKSQSGHIDIIFLSQAVEEPVLPWYSRYWSTLIRQH